MRWPAFANIPAVSVAGLDINKKNRHGGRRYANNKSRVGSSDKGRGVFVLEAGYEVFSGYWYVEGEPSSTQLWCGTRLSHDIVVNLKKGKEFADDFGLSQHPLSNIVDPAD